MNSRVLRIVTDRNLLEFCCCSCYAFHMAIVYERLFLCGTLTWNSDTRNDVNNWLFGTVAGARYYNRRARNTWVHFTVAVQKFAVGILERNCNVHRLMAFDHTTNQNVRNACSLCPSRPSGRRMMRRLSVKFMYFSCVSLNIHHIRNVWDKFCRS
jgi:hypothetical protein